jgi:hypothetical protein
MTISQKVMPGFPFMVRYLTTNGTTDTCGRFRVFALRYRRTNDGESISCGTINDDGLIKSPQSRHPGESRGPEVLVYWIPASAGMTKKSFF